MAKTPREIRFGDLEQEKGIILKTYTTYARPAEPEMTDKILKGSPEGTASYTRLPPEKIGLEDWYSVQVLYFLKNRSEEKEDSAR